MECEHGWATPKGPNTCPYCRSAKIAAQLEDARARSVIDERQCDEMTAKAGELAGEVERLRAQVKHHQDMLLEATGETNRLRELMTAARWVLNAVNGVGKADGHQLAEGEEEEAFESLARAFRQLDALEPQEEGR